MTIGGSLPIFAASFALTLLFAAGLRQPRHVPA